MVKSYILFFVAFFSTFAMDRWIKELFLSGFKWQNSCITLDLVYNKGVAFSMLAFLGENLKYLQIILISSVIFYLFYKKELLRDYALAAGMIIAGGVSNLLDRFIHEGVVDFFHWHCGFDFPGIFNFADVMIDIGVALILFISYRKGAL
jgi:signal peptidase II